MGTTQRMTPGVSGEPNWGDLSKSITNISKTIEGEKELENDQNISSEDAQKLLTKIENRKSTYLRAAFKKFVKTSGGRASIVGGKSSSIGKAGLKSANRIANFFVGVADKGLQKALLDIGFEKLKGKAFEEVLDFLLVYCAESNAGMDETAANSASCEIMKDVAELANNDLVEFEKIIKEFVKENGLAELLCKFWGLYIFEHLSQRFEEKIKQQKGVEIGKDTFKIIKEDILGQVKVLNTKRSVAKIDWRGKDGEREIEKIFDSVINILSNEDN